MIYIYIVFYDNDPEYVESVYDEETFLSKYKDFILTPPIYSNKNYWKKYYSVERWILNSEDDNNSEGIDPEDIEKIIANRKS